jgi:hypothetical protein
MTFSYKKIDFMLYYIQCFTIKVPDVLIRQKSFDEAKGGGMCKGES